MARGGVLVFAVQTVEELEVDPHAHGPARHEPRDLVVVEHGAAHGRHLRQEGRTLELHPLLGQLPLERHLVEQRAVLPGQVLVVGDPLQLVEDKHRGHGLACGLLAQRVVERRGNRLGLQPRILQFAFRFGHLELHVEQLAVGNHAALLERLGILQMAPYAVDHLLPHLDHLPRQRQTEVALDELRNQRVARLVALLDGRLFVDAGRAVGRIDFAAQIEREGHLAADESQAAVLQRQLPVGTEQGVDESADGGYHLGRHHATAEDGLCSPLQGSLLVVEV